MSVQHPDVPAVLLDAVLVATVAITDAARDLLATVDAVRSVEASLMSSPLFRAEPGYRRVTCPSCGATVGHAWDLAEGRDHA